MLKLRILFGVVAIISPLSYIFGNMDFSIHTHQSQKNGVIYIFAHGLGANKTQGVDLLLPNSKVLTHNEWVIHYPTVLFNFPDAKQEAGLYDRAKVNLAQADDCQRLKEVYYKVRAEYPDHQISDWSVFRASVLNDFKSSL